MQDLIESIEQEAANSFAFFVKIMRTLEEFSGHSKSETKDMMINDIKQYLTASLGSFNDSNFIIYKNLNALICEEKTNITKDDAIKEAREEMEEAVIL